MFARERKQGRKKIKLIKRKRFAVKNKDAAIAPWRAHYGVVYWYLASLTMVMPVPAPGGSGSGGVLFEPDELAVSVEEYRGAGRVGASHDGRLRGDVEPVDAVSVIGQGVRDSRRG